LLAFVFAVAFLIWTAFRIGGDKTTIAVDDIGEAVASGVAAISLALAARRSSGRLRAAWALIAAAKLSWLPCRPLPETLTSTVPTDVAAPALPPPAIMTAATQPASGIKDFTVGLLGLVRPSSAPNGTAGSPARNGRDTGVCGLTALCGTRVIPKA